MKKLFRSRDNKIFAGVIGGLGEYFDIDPVLLRFIFIIFLLATGLFPGVIAYLLAVFLIPEASVGYSQPNVRDAQWTNASDS